MSKREMLAFAVAPMVPVILTGMVAAPISFFVFFVGLPISYGVAIALGVPVHLFLKRMGLTDFWWYVMFSYIGACLIAWGIARCPLDPDSIIYLQLFGLEGAVGGFAFWRIARPDVRQPKAEDSST